MSFLGRLTWGWKIRWPNLIHVFLIWYGALWLFVESLTALDRDRFAALQSAEILYVSILASLVATLWRNRFQSSVTFNLGPSASSVTVKFADIFTEPGVRLVPVNEYFDTALGAHVSPNSIHGQLITREFQSDSKLFADTLASALANHSPEIVSRTTGSRHRYPIGTTANISRKGQSYLLFALSHTDLDTLVASSDLSSFTTAMQKAWHAVRQLHNGAPVVSPLVGTGLSRMGLPPRQMLDLLLLTFVAASRESPVCQDLVITLSPATYREHNLLGTMEAWRN